MTEPDIPDFWKPIDVKKKCGCGKDFTAHYLRDPLTGRVSASEFRNPNNTGCGSHGESSGKKGCYLSSAAGIETGHGLDDECLRAMTDFRFGWVRQQPGKLRDLVQYARVAPQIVEAIKSSPDSREIFQGIYERLRGVTKLIASGDNERAYQEYKNMAVELRERFLPGSV